MEDITLSLRLFSSPSPPPFIITPSQNFPLRSAGPPPPVGADLITAAGPSTCQHVPAGCLPAPMRSPHPAWEWDGSRPLPLPSPHSPPHLALPSVGAAVATHPGASHLAETGLQIKPGLAGRAVGVPAPAGRQLSWMAGAFCIPYAPPCVSRYSKLSMHTAQGRAR